MAYHIRILAGQLNRNAGSHVYHLELTRKLAARGHRVSVVCFGSGAAVRDVAEVAEIDPLEVQNVPLVWRFATVVRAWSCNRQLRRESLAEPDIVIGGEHLLLRPHCAMFPDTPMVYLPHSLLIEHEIVGYQLPWFMQVVSLAVYQRIQQWALRHANRTVRFTQAACDVLAKEHRTIRPRFFVNPIGVEVPPEEIARTRRNEVQLLYVGALNARKNLQMAFRALSALKKYDWKLDVVGSGVLCEELVKLSEDLGISDKVLFHGFREDPNPFYRNADLFVFPSRSESLGLVLLESMSHGVPCLAMRADGKEYFNANEELIDDGRTGLLANGERDFAERLEHVLRQPGQRGPLGRAAREHVARHHTWDRHLERYEELFDELCSK